MASIPLYLLVLGMIALALITYLGLHKLECRGLKSSTIKRDIVEGLGTFL